jgi:predicted nucleotidyltransferase component of viral defense system
MNAEYTKNLLKNINQLSKEHSQLNVNEIRLVLALERVIARLQSSKKLKKHIIFKGGFVLYKEFSSVRFTRDIDALAKNISKDKLKNLVLEALEVDIEDGLWFGDIRVKELNEQGEYGAYRFDMAFQIGLPKENKIHKLPRIHLDVGFSDELSVSPTNSKMKSILENIKPISWQVYPIEQIIAEKLQTLIERGSLNSRAKDIYDLVYLLEKPINKIDLKESIKTTFRNRETELPESLSDHIKIFDLERLKSSWGSVKVLDQEIDFENMWNKLILVLSKLD